MHLIALAGQGWRNLAPFRLEPDRRFNIVEGRNGQGKTNLLERTITDLKDEIPVTVIEASPKRLFNRAAMRAILRWKFKPRIIDGRAVTRDAEQTIEFKLDQRCILAMLLKIHPS